MKSHSFQISIFQTSLDVLSLNPVSIPFYLIFLLLETTIKAIYGITILYGLKYLSIFRFFSSLSILEDLVIAFTAFMSSIILMVIALFIWRSKLHSTILKIIAATFMLCSTMIRTWLFVPFISVYISTFIDMTKEGQATTIQVCLAIVGTIFQIVLFFIIDTFLISFYQNAKVPWSQPSSGLAFQKIVTNIAYGMMLAFAHEQTEYQQIIVCIAVASQVLETLISLYQSPYYNKIIDYAHLFQNIFLTYVYSLTLLQQFIISEDAWMKRISFNILLCLVQFLLFFCTFRVREYRHKVKHLLSEKSGKDFEIQYVQLIRLNKGYSNKSIVNLLQGWIIKHHVTCYNKQCVCKEISLNQKFVLQQIEQQRLSQEENHPLIQNRQHASSQIFDNSFTNISYFDDSSIMQISQNNNPLQQFTSNNIQENESQQQKEIKESSIVDFFLSQQLIKDIDFKDAKQMDVDDLIIQKLKEFVLLILNQEIQLYKKKGIQLELIKLSTEVSLQMKAYQSYFKILLLESDFVKLSMRQRYIITSLKSSLIQKKQESNRLKQKTQRIQMENQLKFEKSFQNFTIDIQKNAQLVEELWKMSIVKNGRILKMLQQLYKIADSFQSLYSQFTIMDEKYLNEELLILFARFCDQVMSFEIESERYYSKGMQLLQSLKLKRTHMLADTQIDENHIIQEALVCVESKPKSLDKIIFANQKFLQLSGFRIDELTTIKSILPHILAQSHDQLILNFLNSQTHRKRKRNVKFYMRNKRDHLLYVEVSIMPIISLQNDINFISIIKQTRTIQLRELKLMKKNVLIFLVEKDGKIDSVSKEAAIVLNLTTEILRKDVYLDQLLMRFNLENLDQLLDGSEYKINKTQILTQLVVADSAVRDPPVIAFYEELEDRSQIDEQVQIYYSKLDIRDESSEDYLRLYQNKTTVNGIDIFEIIALPVKKDTTVFQNKMTANFTQNQSREQQQQQVQFSDMDDDEILDDMISQSMQSWTSGSQTSTDTQFQQIKGIKEVNFQKGQSQIIQRLKRSIFLFFSVIFLTAITLLIVNILSKNSFQSDINASDNAFLLKIYHSHLRNKVQWLYHQSNIPIQTQLNVSEYKHQQFLLDMLCDTTQSNLNLLNNQVNFLSQELQDLFSSPDIIMQEISLKGVQSNQTIQFHMAMQETINRALYFARLTPFSMRLNNTNAFKEGQGQLTPSDYPLSQEQIDYYFINYNGKYRLLAQTEAVYTLLDDEIENYSEKTQSIILIFTCICIVIVIISSMLILPMIFNIENILYDNIICWTKIQESKREAHLNKIQLFKQRLQSIDQNYLEKNIKNWNNEISKKSKGKQYNKHNKIKLLARENYKGNKNPLEEVKAEDEIENYKKQSRNIHLSNEQASKFNSQKKKKIGIASEFQLEMKFKEEEKYEEEKYEDQIFDDISMHSSASKEESSNDNQNKQNQINTLEIEVESQHDQFLRENERKALKKHILGRKLKFALIVAMFAGTMSSLYIGSYFLAQDIYHESISNFDMLASFSKRIPCLPRSMYYMAETYVMNQTIYQNGVETIESNQNTCRQLEQSIVDIKSQQTKNLQHVQEILNLVDSDQFCNFWYNLSYGTNGTVEDCKSFASGILQNGLTQTINYGLKLIDQASINYNSAQNKNLIFLQNDLYNTEFQQLFYLMSNYVYPVMLELWNDIDASMYTILAQTFQYMTTMFSIFLVFILFTWIMAFRFFITNLSTTISRASIAVKMVPAFVLLEIKLQQQPQAQTAQVKKNSIAL